MHGLSNKDCKQIFTMSVTCNTQERLLTDIHRPPPQHFFIINTGIKTILNIFLILLVVSTHTASKINTICDNIHCTCYFRQFQLEALSLSKMDKSMPFLFLLLEIFLLFRNTHASTASDSSLHAFIS